MKLRIVGLSMFVLLAAFTSLAQDTFNDEELTKYATVMKWAKMEQRKIRKDVSAAVKTNDALSGAAYNKLNRASKGGDVNSTDATQVEIDAFMAIQDNTEKSKTDFLVTYKEKIGSDIGNGLYNRLKRALKTDAELKARYQVVYDGLESNEKEDDEESDDKTGLNK